MDKKHLEIICMRQVIRDFLIINH